MPEKYLGTLETPEAVHAFVEITPHSRCWPEMKRGDVEGRDLPRAIYLGGNGFRVRIPQSVWAQCKLRPGDTFDRRMYRYDPQNGAEQTSQEPAATGRRYRHLKRDSTYTVLGDGTAQVSGEPIVDGDVVRIYVSDDGKFNVRKSSEFLDGRFEEIE